MEEPNKSLGTIELPKPPANEAFPARRIAETGTGMPPARRATSAPAEWATPEDGRSFLQRYGGLLATAGILLTGSVFYALRSAPQVAPPSIASKPTPRTITIDMTTPAPTTPPPKLKVATPPPAPLKVPEKAPVTKPTDHYPGPRPPPTTLPNVPERVGPRPERPGPGRQIIGGPEKGPGGDGDGLGGPGGPGGSAEAWFAEAIRKQAVEKIRTIPGCAARRFAIWKSCSPWTPAVRSAA